MKIIFCSIMVVALTIVSVLGEDAPRRADDGMVFDRLSPDSWMDRSVRKVFEKRDYDALEKRHQELLSTMECSLEGLPKIEGFYGGLMNFHKKDDASWKQEEGRIEDWCRARPDSLLATAVLARFWTSYGFF